MQFLLQCASYSLLFLSSASAQKCKAAPESPQWPSDADWTALKKAVGGRLTKPAPPAAACHRNWPGYSASACAVINNNWKTAAWHANHPTSNLWQNYNNYSCSPDASSPCSTRGYPLYVVEAKEPLDVKAAIDFARTKNVRLNIKSTGHDFLGRSVQPNSLSIWTRGLQGMKWYETSFTPRGCKSPINGPAVTAGAGLDWDTLYASAKRQRVNLVGGYTGSVSLGGYLSNGGHGQLSAEYGLGADMVLEVALVNAAGQMIVANECQNQDYFWAMRGGGGSTYGVALSYTIQAVRSGPTAKYVGGVSGWSQVTRMHSQWSRLARAGAGGYINGYPGRGGRISVTVYLPNASSVALHSLVNPVMASVRVTAEGEDQDSRNSTRMEDDFESGTYTDYETWDDAWEDISSSQKAFEKRDVLAAAAYKGIGANKIIASWLWSAKDLSSPQLQKALRGALDGETQLLTDATMGAGTWKPPFIRGGGNAVNPAFRTAVMRVASELAWEGTDLRRLEARKKDALRFGASLRSISSAGGTYANEADPGTPNWQHAFWGSNYERLYSIKRKVDPSGVFYCRSCVGSELFDDRAGILCLK